MLLRFCLNPFCREVTSQQIPYTIYSSHQLGLEVERPELRADDYFLLFAILQPVDGNLRVLGDIFSLHIQNRKEPHKIFLSEPTVLSMSFTTRVYETLVRSFLPVTYMVKSSKYFSASLALYLFS